MSTKKQLKEQKAQEEAARKAEQRSGLLVWSYLAGCVLLLAALLIAAKSASVLLKNMRPSKDVDTELASYTPWPKEVRKEFQRILIQNGGRVKPMNTFARFSLLQLNNGTRVHFETEDGTKHKIKADEWLLDTLFRGNVAREFPIFNVDDTDVIAALGVPPKDGNSKHRKRDRYSYNQLIVARAKLADEGQRISEKKEHFEDTDDPDFKLTREEILIRRISRNVSFFEFLLGQFGAVQKGDDHATEILPDHLAQLTERFDMTEFVTGILPQMMPAQLSQILGRKAETPEDQLFQAPFQLFSFFAQTGTTLPIFPPQKLLGEEWNGIGHVMFEGMMSEKDDRARVAEVMGTLAGLQEGQKEMFAALAKFGDDSTQGTTSAAALAKKFGDFVKEQKEATNQRHKAQLADIDEKIGAAKEDLEKKRLEDRRKRIKVEGASSDREVKLYNAGYFHSSLAYFIMGFLILMVSWLVPGSKFSKFILWAAVAVTVLALGYDVWGMIQRCVIRSRPPITNLYDTVIFITAVCVLLGLLLEYFTRIGVGLLIATISGMAGMFLSMRYEIKEATDTMDPLQAVLDTNFWLATHVTTINIGYAAGLTAMLLGAAYLLYRYLRPLPRVLKTFFGKEKSEAGPIFVESKESRTFSKSLAKMSYGIVCFCLIFSIVGTVLGGIWANYSWGRFWGWDPKENGALMICLWSLVILHARMGGMIRDIGIAMNAIFLGMIVMFSWWGVNNLGIGLHSYGFTEGVWKALYTSWAVSLLVMACGIPLWLHERFSKESKSGKRSRGQAKSKKDGVAEGGGGELGEGAAPA